MDPLDRIRNGFANGLCVHRLLMRPWLPFKANSAAISRDGLFFLAASAAIVGTDCSSTGAYF